MYIVYSEDFIDGSASRWFYGAWEDRNEANRVACELNKNGYTKYCVCSNDNALVLSINNVPQYAFNKD